MSPLETGHITGDTIEAGDINALAAKANEIEAALSGSSVLKAGRLARSMVTYGPGDNSWTRTSAAGIGEVDGSGLTVIHGLRPVELRYRALVACSAAALVTFEWYDETTGVVIENVTETIAVSTFRSINIRANPEDEVDPPDSGETRDYHVKAVTTAGTLTLYSNVAGARRVSEAWEC